MVTESMSCPGRSREKGPSSTAHPAPGTRGLMSPDLPCPAGNACGAIPTAPTCSGWSSAWAGTEECAPRDHQGAAAPRVPSCSGAHRPPRSWCQALALLTHRRPRTRGPGLTPPHSSLHLDLFVVSKEFASVQSPSASIPSQLLARFFCPRVPLTFAYLPKCDLSLAPHGARGAGTAVHLGWGAPQGARRWSARHTALPAGAKGRGCTRLLCLARLLGTAALTVTAAVKHQPTPGGCRSARGVGRFTHSPAVAPLGWGQTSCPRSHPGTSRGR